MAIDDAHAKAFRDQDLIYRNFFRMKPGKYHLKLVVMDERGKMGTAQQDLVIPAFNQGTMTASSLIVSQEMVPLPGLIKELQPQMLSQADPMQFKGFQIYAPVNVEIDRQRPFVVFYRIYAVLAHKTFKANVRATDEKGESHPFPLVDLGSSALPVSDAETAVGFLLPAGDLKPGKYHLTVETVEAGSGQSVVSEADFQLR